MSNHYHLLVETVHGELSRGMRDLNGIYTQQYNKRHATVGHILQGRFSAFLIEKETYFFTVARYIVLNPVRAGLVKLPEEYPWSSYRQTIGLDRCQAFLSAKDFLQNFADDRKNARLTYRDFVLEGRGSPSPLLECGRGRVLGSPQFITQIWSQTDDFFQERPENAKEEKLLGRPLLTDLFVDEMSLHDRNVAISIAIKTCGYSNIAVARLLSLSPASVSMILKKTIEH